MQFKDFEKRLKGIRYRTEKEWEIFLPFNTKQVRLQQVINICRDLLMVNWHIIFTAPTDENPEPEIRMYWDVYTE